MKTCVNGHPHIPENRQPSKKRGSTSCRICSMERKRAVRRAAGVMPRATEKCVGGHPMTAKNRRTSGTGGSMCRLCENLKRRKVPSEAQIAYRLKLAEVARERAERMNAKAAATDGFEDLFGPIPAKVPSYQWYDEAVVLRVLHGGGPTIGRDLTPSEKRAIVKRAGDVSFGDIARRAGASQQAVSQWFKRYGEGVKV